MPQDSLDDIAIHQMKIANDSSTNESLRINQNYSSALLEPPRISEFVRRIFQDKNGNLWFGTNGDGVIRFDGDTLAYFSIAEGFGGVAVRGIVEDRKGNIWFGTEQGLTKLMVAHLPILPRKMACINNDIWSMTIDRNGIIWIGTLQGVCRFDGEDIYPYLPFLRPSPIPARA